MHNGQLKQRFCAAAALFLGLIAGQASALDCTFDIQGPAPFNVPGNWSCGQVPGPADTARIESPTVQLTESVSVGTLVLTGGQIDFTDGQTLTVVTQAIIGGGRLNSAGSGTLNLAPGSTAIISPSSAFEIGNVVLNNQGAVDWRGDAIRLTQPGAALVNRGSISLTGPAPRALLTALGSIPNAIQNLGAGAVFLVGSDAVLQLDAGIGVGANTGTIRVSNGELVALGLLQLPGTVDLEPGAQLRASNGLRLLGTLIGSDTARIFGGVLNQGTLRPRGLRISGDFEQSPGGTLAYAFSTPLQGALFVDGTARFAGTIRTTTPGGFTVPANGQLLVEAGAQTGAFGTTDNQIPSSLVVVLPQSSKVYLTRPTPTFAIVGDSVVEGSTGTRPLRFGVSLLPPAGVVQTVELATVDGSATQPTDYTPVNARVLTFQPGQTFIATDVLVNGDVTVEPNENFSGTLSNSSGPTIDLSSALGQINNDDGGVSCTFIASGPAPFDDPGAWSGCSGGSGAVAGTPGPLDAVIIPNGMPPVDFFAPATVNILTISGGLMASTPAAPLQVLSRVNWESGVIGNLIVGPDAIAEVSVSATNAAVGNLTVAGQFRLLSQLGIGEVDVLRSGKFEVSGSGSTELAFDAIGPPGITAFTNQGVFTKSGAGIFSLEKVPLLGRLPARFVNHGRAEFLGGTARIEIYDNTGVTVINGGTLQSGNALLLRAGRLETGPGSQNVIADIINQAGELRPGGAGFAQLLINGDYQQGPGAQLTLQVDGPTAGANADQVNVSGTVQLNGTLRVAKPGAFNPPPLSNYDLMNYENNFSSLFSNVINEFSGTTVVTSTGRTSLNGPGPTPIVTVANVSVNEAAGIATIVATVSPAPAPGSPVGVNYITQDATAISPADYAFTSGTLSFTDVSPTASFTVTLNNDLLNEDDETFRVDLSAPTGGLIIGPGNPSTVTITNDDPLPTLSWTGNRSLPEGNSGTSNMGFELALSAPSGRTLSVDVATALGTASGGKDYVEIAPPQTFVFNPGQINRAVSVTINGDTVAETNETFLVRMSNAVNVIVPAGAAADATGEITNDDLPTVSLGAASVDVAEGAGTISLPVTVSVQPTVDVFISFTTSAGTAMADVDYTSSSGMLTFTPTGPTTQNIIVPISEDLLDEAIEDFAAQLTMPMGLIPISPTSTAVSILDNDAPPFVQFGAASYSLGEGNTGTTPLNFALNLTAVSGLDVTVPVTTSAVSATSGTDYQPVNQNFLIPAGQTSLQVPVQIIGDIDFEPDETFTVELGTPIHATLGSIFSTTGTITNDDAAGGVVCTWNGSNGAWNVPGNWLNCFGGNGVPANTPGPGDTAIINAGVVDATTPALITIARLEQRGASVVDGGDLVISDSCIWESGRQANAGAKGTFTISAGAVCSFGANSPPGRQLDNRRLVNLGTINFTGSSHTQLADSSVIENGAPGSSGVINFNLGAGNAAFIVPQLPTDTADFRNTAQGTLTFATGDSVIIGTDFNNAGQVTIDDGFFGLEGTGIDTGRYDVAAGTLLSYGGDARRLEASGIVAGAGEIEFFSPVDAVILGDLQVDKVTVSSGGVVQFNRAGGAVLRNLVVGSSSPPLARGVVAEVTGTADIAITTSMEWYGGTITSTAGTPTVTLNSGANATMEGFGPDHVLNRPLQIRGGLEWSARDIELSPSGGIEVFPTGSMLITTGAQSLQIRCPSCTTTPALLRNRGEMRKDGGAPVGFSQVAFEQEGNLLLEQGALTVFSFVQRGSSALTSLDGGSLALPMPLRGPGPFALEFEAGVLRSTVAGTGDLVASVINSGADVQPGGAGASGRIRVFGNYNQQLNGRSSFEVGGLLAGTEFDQLDAGSITLANGTLINTAAISGFNPAAADTFRLMTSASRTGTASLGSNAFAGYFLDYSTPGEVIYARAPLPTLTLAPATLTEGNTGTSSMDFVATLSAVSSVPVTFQVDTTDGSAQAPSDYTALSNQLISIPANTLSFNVSVAIVGDSAFESDESFSLSVSNVSNAILSGGPSYTGTILNDDNAGGITCTWNGSSGFWNLPSNWLNCAGGSGVPIGTPGPLDTAIVNSGDVNASAPPLISVRRFEQRGPSTLRGGSLTVTESCVWDSGTQTNLGRGAGAFTIAAGAVCSFGPNAMSSVRVLESRTLNNLGTINYTGESIDTLASGALFANGSASAAGVINFNVPSVELTRFGQIVPSPPSSFVNAALGTINFNSGALLDFALPFTNDGVVNVSGQETDISGDGTDGGRFTVASGSVLRYGSSAGRTLAPAAIVDGNGTLSLRGNNTILGNLLVESTEVGLNSVATFNRAGGANLRRLIVGSPSFRNAVPQPQGAVPALVTGAADITVSTELVWLDGTITASSGSPEITLASSATGQWGEGNASFRVLDRRMRINGALNWSSGDVQTLPARQFVVEAGGALAITGPASGSFGLACGTCTSLRAEVINRGSISKAGVGDVNFTSAVNFAQQGQLTITEGLLRVENFVQSTAAATTSLLGGRLGNAGVTSTFNGGALLSAPGVISEIDGPVANNGANFQPGGTQAGAIRVLGNYVQVVDGISFDIGGAIPVTGFDQFLVTGAITLNAGAVLNTVQRNGFIPVQVAQFVLMSGASRTGTATLGANAFPFYGLDFATAGQVIYGPLPQPTLTLAPATAPEGNAGASPLNFVATLSGVSSTAVTFNVTTTAGTATAGTDFTALTAQPITIPPNTLSINVPVQMLGDTIFETDETLTLSVANVVGANFVTSSGFLGTIQNDDAAPLISIESSSVIEGNSGFTNALVGVRRTGTSQLGSTVSFATEAATALSPSDFEAATGTLNFAPNETLKFILVRVVGDTVAEADETFRVRLSAFVNAAVSGAGVADITITNDDAETVQLSICGARTEEGRGPYLATLTRTGTNPISVTYFTSAVTATPGQDYTPTSGTVTWPANDVTPRSISIPILDDALIESNEEFVLALEKVSPGGVLGTPNTQLIRIGDNDERIFSDDLERPGCL